jgi:hypothetical protein
MCISTAWTPQSFQLLWRGACCKIRELVSVYSLDWWRTDEPSAVKLFVLQVFAWLIQFCWIEFLYGAIYIYIYSYIYKYIYSYIYRAIYVYKEREREKKKSTVIRVQGLMLTGTFSTVHICYLQIQFMIKVTLLLLVIRPINRILLLTLNVTNSSTNTERVMNLVAERLWTTRDIKLFRLQIH